MGDNYIDEKVGQPIVLPTERYWGSFTSLATTGLGTTNSMAIDIYQKGRHCKGYGRFQAGTTSATAITLTLPNSWTAFHSSTLRVTCGRWWANQGSATQFKYGDLNCVNGSGVLNFGIGEYTVGALPVGAAFNGSNFATNTDIFVEFDLVLTDFIPTEYTAFGVGQSNNVLIPSIMKTYVSSQAARVKNTSASYVILDMDGYEDIFVTTAASSLTVTLPSPVLNVGRRILIKKVDAGAGIVTVTRFASETIDGVAANIVLGNRNTYLIVTSDGTNWAIESSFESVNLSAASFTFGNVNAQPASGTVRFSRSGSLVTIALKFSTVTVTASGTITINYGAVASLARYIPAVQQFVAGGYGAGSPTGYPTSMYVTTAGVVTLYKDNTINFAAGNTLASPTDYLTFSFLID